MPTRDDDDFRTDSAGPEPGLRSPLATRDLGRPRAFDADAAAAGDSGLFGLTTPCEEAAAVVVPVPYDATTSHGTGAAFGPAAILEASRQVDLFDPEYGRVYEGGIAMLPIPEELAELSRSTRRLVEPIVRRGGARPGDADDEATCRAIDLAGERVNAWVAEQVRECLDGNRFACVLGGDHSVPFALIDELARRRPGLGILHVDAHCDLRVAYEGFRWSHASIMSEVMERCAGVSRLVQVGIRDVGEAEIAAVESSDGRIVAFLEPELRAHLARGGSWDAACRRVIAELPDEVHVSFDIDGLEPALCPSTGTPVPGGLDWGEACHLLRTLVESGRTVVGFDLVEVVPGEAHGDWDANVGARLLYKLLGAARASR